jgi:hypothetical protein
MMASAFIGQKGKTGRMESWNNREVRGKRLRLRFRCHPEQGEGSPRFFTELTLRRKARPLVLNLDLNLIVFHPTSNIPLFQYSGF